MTEMYSLLDTSIRWRNTFISTETQAKGRFSSTVLAKQSPRTGTLRGLHERQVVFLPFYWRAWSENERKCDCADNQSGKEVLALLFNMLGEVRLSANSFKLNTPFSSCQRISEIVFVILLINIWPIWLVSLPVSTANDERAFLEPRAMSRIKTGMH